jgi:hypothetical protein
MNARSDRRILAAPQRRVQVTIAANDQGRAFHFTLPGHACGKTHGP